MRKFKILFVVFFYMSLNVLAQSDKLFKIIDEKSETISQKERGKIQILKSNKIFKSHHVVNIGNINALENRKKLPVNIPGIKGVFMAERTKIEVYNANEFIWEGKFPNEDGGIFINSTKDGIFGRIKYIKDTYNIENIGEGKSLISQYDNTIFTEYECGTVHDKIENLNKEPKLESRTTCSHLPIRVGVLFSQNAQNTGLNMNNIAVTAINDLNNTLSNSNVASNIARFQLSGVQFLQGFNETQNAWTDLLNVRHYPVATSFKRNTFSDLVIVLTNGNYAGLGGIAIQGPSVGGGDSYAIVQANIANARYTFSHETIHLLGGRHQQRHITPSLNADNEPGYAHGFLYRTGLWPFRREWTTLMHTETDGVTRKPELSFPPSKGTAEGNDNARMVRENACLVAQYETNPLSISIDGLYQMPRPSYGTWCLSIYNCSNIQIINWEVSYDGWNYISAGNTACITQFFNSPTLYLRATVTCTDGQTQTAFFIIYEDSGFPIKPVQDEQNIKKVSEIVTYPNPANSTFSVIINNVNSNPKRVILTDWKGQEQNIDFAYDESSKLIFAHINSNSLNNGVYVVSCLGSENILSKKIIIQHE